MSRIALVITVAASAGALIRSPTVWLAPNVVAVIIAFAAFGAVVACERRSPFLRAGTVAALSGGLIVLAVVSPPLRSNDVWSYAAYGRMVSEYRSSPHTHSPADFPGDPVADRVSEVWRTSPSVYGPAFTVVAAAGMAVAGTSALAARLYFQVVAAAAVAAALVLIWRRTRDPMALAFVGLNPLTTVSVVNGAHNDALVGLAVLGAVLLATRGRWAWAGVAMAAGALVKVAAVVPMAVLGLWVGVHGGLAAAAAFGGAGAAVVLGGLLAAGGREALAPLGDARLRFTNGSVWSWPRRWLGGSTGSTGPTGGPGGPVGSVTPDDAVSARLATASSAAVAALTALLAAVRVRLASPAPAVAAGVLAYMLVGSYVTPWYVAWSLPTLALCWRSRLAWLAVVHAGLLLLTSLRSPVLSAELFRSLVSTLYRTGIPLFEVAALAVIVAVSVAHLRRRRRGRVQCER